jgi:hypothetical protein
MFSLESGWWNTLSVTNSIFVNTFMFGDISATYGYLPPFSFNESNGGTIRIDSVSSFGFKVPFTDQERHILFTNSSYGIEQWLSYYMRNNSGSINAYNYGFYDEIPVPQPMLSPITLKFFDSTENGEKVFPYINRADLYDSTDPHFMLPPSDTTAIEEFLWCKWWSGGCDYHWPWKPDNSINHLWPLEESLAYTNATIKTAAMGGFPLGDLYHWWPQEYAKWEVQKEAENSRISFWLDTGRDSIFSGVKKEVDVVNEFVLLQNYPNPFNPTTNFEFQAANFGLVTLKVYDLLGREVAVLINKEMPPGKYKIRFTVGQDSSPDLASGIYFYQLRAMPIGRQAGNFVQTKKCLLLK